ncbi:MAG TPA: phosphatase PAP2 family protein [Candidatus Marinimicrobia bacterium]|nr:phosphatase PAP2 family protein [Candidatus Neomarinimicrobiota bacterium]
MIEKLLYISLIGCLLIKTGLNGAELALKLPPPNPVTQPLQYLQYYPPHYWNGWQKTLDWKPNAPLFFAGAILIPMSFLGDQPIQENVGEHNFLPEDISRIGNIYGHRWGNYAAAVAVGINGVIRHQPWNKTFSQIELLATSTITTALVTEAIKLATHRERPNAENYKSFPSGHSSNSFALAAGLNGIYGYKMGIPAYLMAFFVASTRINDNKHYLSDVVTGALIGTWIGTSFSRQYQIEWQISDAGSPAISINIPF